ncbi:hypothetical protein [Thalassoroseus pseudoceratinae]|uniref:hypothetical protein n=1 Tax=Thalassoroseus pseudoceratinae TaxID=2713176 RepID=UPI001423AAB9|nr:hypothetical protein [Thalassoroseus pseudoceratinae]
MLQKRFRNYLVAASAAVCLAVSWTSPVSAQPTLSGPATTESAAVVSDWRTENPHEFIGIIRGRCAQCHNSEQGDVRPTTSANLPSFLQTRLRGLRNDGWIRGDELIIWGANDKHTQAYTVLLNERSKQMAKILGVVDSDGNSQIHRDVRCLTCHVGMPAEQMLAAKKSDERQAADQKILGHEWLVADSMMDDDRVTFGVNCESCHGPAGTVIGGTHEGWAGIHVDAEEWRFKPAAEKEKDYSYWDVRSPVSKTRICLSCHLGNVAEGKVVTHEMYAAGHPPLPGFETSTFIHQEPRHWREFEEKSEMIRTEFEEKAGDKGEFISPELNQTQDVLIGSVASLAEYMKLNADLANKEAECAVPKPEWPELANFACYACHHDLQERGWRLTRPPVRTPGRPRLHEWPTALSDIALKLSGADLDEYERLRKAVDEAVDRQPFGEASQIDVAARNLSNWLFQQAKAMEKNPPTPADAKMALKEIAEKGADEQLDYDATRQLVWAAGIIYNELNPLPLTEEAKNNRYKIDAVPGWYKTVTDLDKTQELLAQFDKVFLLDLRKGRDAGVMVPGENEDRPVVEVDLDKSLPRIGDFQPRSAADLFKVLKERLATE